MYQLGNLLLYLLVGETIDGENRVDEAQFREILERVPSNELRSIIAQMLALEPWSRPSAEEAAKTLAKLHKGLEEFGRT